MKTTCRLLLAGLASARRLPIWFWSLVFAAAMPGGSRAEVIVRGEQLNPADAAWHFKTIPGPSKTDIAAGAKVRMVGNQFEAAAADGTVLVNGVLPSDSLDLSEGALLSNANSNGGHLVLDLGRVQPVAAVASYSWHEWEVDQGSRGPQVYTLYGSAAASPDPAELSGWTKIAVVDTRPNRTGAKWNGQHGVFISANSGTLGEFRHLLFAVQRTASPLQPNVNLTGTLFCEIDVHSAATLAHAGDAVVARPAPVDHIWVVFKTHLDIGYTDRIDDVLKKYRVAMMEGALQVVDASGHLPPEKRFSWTLAGWPLAHVLGPQQDPHRRTRIEQAVRDGAIVAHALPFTTHTETQDLEDLVRGLGYASRLSRQYGRPLPIGAKMTDVPCHSWVMPTLLANAGVKFLQLGCNDTSAFVRVPSLFWWEGPDGSRILCNYTRVYGSGLKPPRDWPAKNYLAMVMTYDNQGPPSVADVERLRQQAARELPVVQVHFGTLDDFARAVIAENPALAVVRADMPDTWIHGWLSMPLEAKAVRQARALEPVLDSLDTHLRAWGLTPSPLVSALSEAYEQSGLFSEHTFGPFAPNGGSWNSRTPRYLYGEAWKAAYARGAYRKYEEAFDDKRAFARRAQDIVQRELSGRLDLLAKSVRADGRRVLVYNGLPWVRSGAVAIPGEPDRFLFAKDVPANGYRTYPLDTGAPAPGPQPPVSTNLDARFYQVTFDVNRGGIASLVDKRTGRELVDQRSPYVLGQFLHERFDEARMRAFHEAYGRPGYSWPKGDLPKNTAYAALTPTPWTLAIRRTAVADVVTLTASNTLGLARGLALVFTLAFDQPTLEVEWRVTEKTADPLPEGGWLCFPFAVEQPRFRLGRLAGSIDPAQDIVAGANPHYFCVNTGVLLRDRDESGVGLCPLDSPCLSLERPGLWQYSLDYVPQKGSVFVNLYNNEWNTNFPEWQEGSWCSRVRLWPVRGQGEAQGLTVPCWEARSPLLAALAEGPGGQLPPTRKGLEVSRPGVLVTAFGPNPDGDGTVLRVWEQGGASGPVAVVLPGKFASATPVNLRGEKTGPPNPIAEGRLSFPVRAYAPASFILE
jgi:alpha-mannosidase